MRALRAGWLAASLVATTACIGTTPEEAAEEALGEDSAEEGPTHRPGQPCLVCHGEDHDPGGEVFLLAGTVYRRADDADGLQGAEVEITDEQGDVITVTTNRVGTFLVSVGEVDDDRRDEGWIGVARAPDFPLRVTVRANGTEKEMRNVIHREGSCAACHDRAGAGAASAGKVFVEDEP